MTPLISVIMPVYNREQLVKQAIDSVLSQTCSDWEFLAVDDGSTDGTRQVLDSYGPRLTVLSSTHVGAYQARNMGLNRARGEYIAFIDSDDRWLPQRLAVQLPLFKSAKVGLVFGNASFRDERSGTTQLRTLSYFDLLRPSRGNVLKSLSMRNFIPQSSVLVRRSCFEKLGPFSRAANVACDYAKWVELAMHYEVDFVPEIVFEYTQHGDNLSRDLKRSFRSRVILFEELLTKTKKPEQREALHRILFNLKLYLALTDTHETFPQMKQALFGSSYSVPYLRRGRWALDFAAEQLRLIYRRLS